MDSDPSSSSTGKRTSINEEKFTDFASFELSVLRQDVHALPVRSIEDLTGFHSATKKAGHDHNLVAVNRLDVHNVMRSCEVW